MLKVGLLRGDFERKKTNKQSKAKNKIAKRKKKCLKVNMVEDNSELRIELGIIYLNVKGFGKRLNVNCELWM